MCNNAFNNPAIQTTVAECWRWRWGWGWGCSHALHIRVHHILLRHISICWFRWRDTKLCDISILSAFISWWTDDWPCSGTSWYWSQLKIGPQVIQISILQFTGFLVTKKRELRHKSSRFFQAIRILSHIWLSVVSKVETFTTDMVTFNEKR